MAAVWRTPAFIRDCIAFARMNRSPGEWPFGRFYPYLGDRRAAAGTAKGHYFHQDLLVARRIYECNPVRHVDVGSRVDGFVAHVASFRKIEVADIRPLKASIANVAFTQIDLMAPLAAQHLAMCDSLSCLHALEHFGLGRYGDRLDPDGHLTGLANLARMLGEDGILYLSVPIGPQRIDFNSERVFGMAHMLDLLDRAGFDLLRFSCVDDDGDLIENQTLSPVLVETNCGVEYGCGIFELTKRRQPGSAAS
ncbi:MAG: DUF268 domain-containing protein [Bauldia sp.]